MWNITKKQLISQIYVFELVNKLNITNTKNYTITQLKQKLKKTLTK